MLTGLFEADLAIKANVMEEEPALAAWLGEYLLAHARERAARRRRPGRRPAEHAIGLDRERAACAVEAQDADQLLVDVELAAGHAQRAGDGEEEPLLGLGIAEDRVEDARQQRAAAEAAGLDRSVARRAVMGRSMRTRPCEPQ